MEEKVKTINEILEELRKEKEKAIEKEKEIKEKKIEDWRRKVKKRERTK